ncbi:PqiB family protein [Yoonia sp. 208BN28-4]|uniref:PqiB family protein n=1 Tax=Yoonia sp. 208BN28-4 TaxID=3126505 RepID=UPI0030AB63B1
MTDQNSPADLDVRDAKPRWWRRISFVWLVPLVALAVSLSVAYQNYLDQGTLVEIAFENASGISSETKIKYRDVNVGEVEKVEFAEGLDVILVYARVDKEIAPYLDQDAQFWVVRPDVSVRGISGLDTVLSGVYIEGNWDTDPDQAQTMFTGLEEPPLVRASQRGTQIVLTAIDGSSLATGAPILHKGIQVGYLEKPELAPNGREVLATAFIEAPYDRRITTATRFWDTSGFSVSVGAAGLSLDVSSIASIIEGGIAFDTFASGGGPIRDGQTFAIFGNQEEARDNLFVDPDRETLDVAVYFDETVSGLNIGADVRYRGIRVGRVTALNARVIESADGADVQLRTILSIETDRLGMQADSTSEEGLALLEDFVAQGVRARLATSGLLSQNLIVELVRVADVPDAQITYTEGELPLLPSTDSNIAERGATAEGLLQRVSDLPVEEVMQSAIDLMDSAENLIASEGLQSAPDEVLGLLQDVRGLIASEAIQSVPADVQAVLTQLDDAIANFNNIATQATENNLVGRLADAIETANTAVANIDTGTANLPAIMAEVEALAAKANALELEALVNQTSQTLSSIDGLVGSEETNALPGSVNTALDEIRGLVADFREGGAADNLNAALASANEAASAVEGAVSDLPELSQQASDLLANIDTALENLPQITAEIEALVAKANGVEIDSLVAQTESTLDAIEALVADTQAAELPASLSAALDEMRGVLADVREGGAVQNVNAALNSANQAAQAIERAAASLPGLTQRANALAIQTGDVLENFGERGRFNAETLATLRDIQAAADAVSSLARAIQRNPNSLLTGR